MATLQDREDELKRRAAAVANILASDDGRLLLEAIEQEFLGDGRRLLGKDPQETGYRVGAHDVVVYLRELEQFHKKGG
jgi:hypothetical protein